MLGRDGIRQYLVDKSEFDLYVWVNSISYGYLDNIETYENSFDISF